MNTPYFLKFRLTKSVKGNRVVTLSRGITLLELMITLGIVSIMLAVGGPSVVGMLNNNAQVGAVNTLISGISTTRTYALSHKRPFVMEEMDGDWSNGFHIKPGTIAGDSLIDTALEDGTEITVTSDLPASFISFDRLGRATPASAVFTICNANTGNAVLVDVNIFGNAVARKNADESFAYEAC